jgi:Protein of unknown function (DUF1360)
MPGKEPEMTPLTDTHAHAGSDGRATHPTQPAHYGAVNLTYLALFTAVVASVSRRADEASYIRGRDLPPLGLATFALAKTVAREKIATWVRDPFIEESPEHKPVAPRGQGLRHAVGELLTCTRCVGAWAALAVVGLRAASPRAGQLATAVLATSGINDFLQAGFRYATERADRRALLPRL